MVMEGRRAPVVRLIRAFRTSHRPVGWSSLTAVRHGEADAAAPVGTDPEDGPRPWPNAHDAELALTERGRVQAVAVGRRLAGHWNDSATVWVSPYLRARQTADLALAELGCPGRAGYVVDERLRERESGGRALQVLPEPGQATTRTLACFYDRPPGGEAWTDVILRLRAWLADLDRLAHGRPVVVFAHHQVILLLRHILQDIPDREFLAMIGRGELDVPHGSLSRIDRVGDRMRIAFWGSSEHLPRAH